MASNWSFINTVFLYASFSVALETALRSKPSQVQKILCGFFGGDCWMGNILKTSRARPYDLYLAIGYGIKVV